MSAMQYKGLCRAEVKLKFRICYRPRMFKCKTFVWGKLLQLYWSICKNARAARAQPLSGVMTTTERSGGLCSAIEWCDDND